MAEPTVMFRARVPAKRLRRAGRILEKLGMKPGDAFNMMLAQIELREGLPFEIGRAGQPLLSAEEQADAWREAFGAY
jgi:addiction module RelB/DinJ family antitoxin